MKADRSSRLIGNVVPLYQAGREKSPVKCNPIIWRSRVSGCSWGPCYTAVHKRL